MWCNKWRSGESEMVCCVSSISNTLYFVGDSEAGESIKKLRHISRDPTTLSQIYPNVNLSSSIRYNELDYLIQILITGHKYKVQNLFPGVFTDISMVVEFLGAIQLPMILSISNKGPNGFSKMNHVIGIYRNNIIDGEYTHNRILNEENLHLACGENVNFHRICKGYILIPPTTINLPHTIREDYNFRSYKYKVVNNKGEGQYFTLHPKNKGRKRKYSSGRGRAGIAIATLLNAAKKDKMCEHWDNG